MEICTRIATVVHVATVLLGVAGLCAQPDAQSALSRAGVQTAARPFSGSRKGQKEAGGRI